MICNADYIGTYIMKHNWERNVILKIVISLFVLLRSKLIYYFKCFQILNA